MDEQASWKWGKVKSRDPESYFLADEVESEEFKKLLSSLSPLSKVLRKKCIPDDLVYFYEDPECFVVAADVPVRNEGYIARSLRADFYEDFILVGEDPTKQFLGPLEAGSEGVHKFSFPKGNYAEASKLVTDWFELELDRKLLRLVWELQSGRYTRLILKDTGERLSWNDAKNIVRPDEELGDPDFVLELKIGEDF